MSPSPAGPTPPHLDLDQLAELDEELPDAETAAARRRHLDSCADCRSAAGRIRQTRALLSSLPAEPMPADVAARLDASLRGAPMSVIAAGPRRRSWWSRPSAAALAAAVAGIALVTGVVVGTTLHSSGPSRPSRSAAGASHSSPHHPAADYPVLDRGAHYTRADAATLVSQLAALSRTPAAAPSPVGTAAHPAVDRSLLALYTSRAALQRCVDKLTAGGPPTTPLAVDFGYYTDRKTVGTDKPALVVLLPGLSAGHADAYIVGPACATAPDNNLYLYESVSTGS